MQIYQAFELNKEKFDEDERLKNLAPGRILGYIGELRSGLEKKGYRIIQSIELYGLVPKLILLEIKGNVPLGSPSQEQIKKDFNSKNKGKFPYIPTYFLHK